MARRNLTVRDSVRRRAHNCCDICRTDLSRRKDGKRRGTIHHRLPRRLGGPDTLTNLLLLCSECHVDIHRDESEAARNGWIAWVDPEMTPINLPCGWVLLVPDGNLEPLGAEEGPRMCAYMNGIDFATVV